MRGVFLCKDTEGVHDIRYLLRHASQDGLFGVPESSIEDALFESEELVAILAYEMSIIGFHLPMILATVLPMNWVPFLW